MKALARLSGADGKAEQDDFQKGTGVYIQKFKGNPSVKIAQIQKEVGSYKVTKVQATITSKVAEKDGKWMAGAFALANPKDDDCLKVVKEKHDKTLLLSGVVTEDDKGNQTITLSKVAEAK
jgi:hypothetical protein